MDQKYRSNHNIVYSCKYHVVWCTKYRRDILHPPIDERLKQIVRQICSDTETELMEMEVMPDHVHLLLEVDPQYGAHRVIKRLKGTSSRLLRREYRDARTRLPSLWTNSYFISSVGGAPLATIKRYIEDQKHV